LGGFRLRFLDRVVVHDIERRPAEEEVGDIVEVQGQV